MKEGPHTEIGNDPAEPAGKVVRLPRDWLGSRDELVPFGRQAAPPDLESATPEMPDSPPSADDFWGERSAAIHNVVSATVGEETTIRGGHSRSLPRVRLGRHSMAIASFVVVAVAGTIGLLLAGSGQHTNAGARLDIASALRNGVRILKIGPPRIVSANRGFRPHGRRIARASHRPRLAKPAPPVTQHSPASTPTYAARAATASAAPSYRSSVTVSSPHAGPSPPPPNRSPSSGATASPTGAFGALGPIQSPNG